jgi:hypothetical protein
MTDSNTKGLTGKVLKPEEYYDTLEESDHWARFEGFGFTTRIRMLLVPEGKGNSYF